MEILNHRLQTHRLHTDLCASWVSCSTFPAVSVCLAEQHCVWIFQCGQNLKLGEPGWKRLKGAIQKLLQKERHWAVFKGMELIALYLIPCLSLSLFFSCCGWNVVEPTRKYIQTHTFVPQINICTHAYRYLATHLFIRWWSTWALSYSSIIRTLLKNILLNILNILKTLKVKKSILKIPAKFFVFFINTTKQYLWKKKKPSPLF